MRIATVLEKKMCQTDLKSLSYLPLSRDSSVLFFFFFAINECSRGSVMLYLNIEVLFSQMVLSAC